MECTELHHHRRDDFGGAITFWSRNEATIELEARWIDDVTDFAVVTRIRNALWQILSRRSN